MNIFTVPFLDYSEYFSTFDIRTLDILLYFFLNNQPDALIIQIHSFIKLYMFRASSLPIIRSFYCTFGTGNFHAGF